MSSLVMERRARKSLRRSVARRAYIEPEHIKIIGYDDDGPVLDIPESFVYTPKESATGALILPKEWAD